MVGANKCGGGELSVADRAVRILCQIIEVNRSFFDFKTL